MNALQPTLTYTLRKEKAAREEKNRNVLTAAAAAVKTDVGRLIFYFFLL